MVYLTYIFLQLSLEPYMMLIVVKQFHTMSSFINIESYFVSLRSHENNGKTLIPPFVTNNLPGAT